MGYDLAHHNLRLPVQAGFPPRCSDLGGSGGREHRSGAGHVQPRGAALRRHGVPGPRRPQSVPQDTRACRGRAYPARRH